MPAADAADAASMMATRSEAKRRPRVLVPRPREQAAALCDALSARGLEPIVAPALLLQAEPEEHLRAAMVEAGAVDRVLFTSAPAVRYFPLDVLPAGVPVTAIGARTKQALEERGVRVHSMPEAAHAEGALAHLLEVLGAASTVLLPRAERARPVLERGLAQAGHRVALIVTYRALPVAGEEAARLARCAREVDAIALTSGAIAEAVVAAAGLAALSGKRVAAIGPVTEQAARALGLSVHVTSARPDVRALADALATLLLATDTPRAEDALASAAGQPE